MPTRSGSFHLFRFRGIDVYLHWYWFLAAAIELTQRKGQYSSFEWNVLEYLALFLIVLFHEFGHALACRQVGGFANQIMLWPLGGIAYVSPPPRPGATLWTIAAGPLVNVVLFPFLLGASVVQQAMTAGQPPGDFGRFLHVLWAMDLGLLVFNLLPAYPLDGGQILRALLWFVVGRARSLLIAAAIGGVVGVGVVLQGLRLYSVKNTWFWYALVGLFMLSRCWAAWKQGRQLRGMELAPRHTDACCPACHTAPPQGNYWQCPRCRTAFDMIAAKAACPHCAAAFGQVPCPHCGKAHPLAEWASAVPAEHKI